jgi:hypothetical protein
VEQASAPGARRRRGETGRSSVEEGVATTNVGVARMLHAACCMLHAACTTYRPTASRSAWRSSWPRRTRWGTVSRPHPRLRSDAVLRGAGSPHGVRAGRGGPAGGGLGLSLSPPPLPPLLQLDRRDRVVRPTAVARSHGWSTSLLFSLQFFCNTVTAKKEQSL